MIGILFALMLLIVLSTILINFAGPIYGTVLVLFIWLVPILGISLSEHSNEVACSDSTAQIKPTIYLDSSSRLKIVSWIKDGVIKTKVINTSNPVYFVSDSLISVQPCTSEINVRVP